MKWVLLLALILAPSLHAQSADSPYVKSLRTRDSVGLNEAIPMIGQYPPPRVYAKWLAEIVVCEGLSFPTKEQLGRLTFWEVNAQNFQINDDTFNTPIAVTDAPAGRMYVSIVYVWDEQTIKHEFLHFMLRWKYGMAYPGKGDGHPLEYFGRCGMHPY